MFPEKLSFNSSLQSSTLIVFVQFCVGGIAVVVVIILAENSNQRNTLNDLTAVIYKFCVELHFVTIYNFTQFSFFFLKQTLPSNLFNTQNLIRILKFISITRTIKQLIKYIL